MHAPTGAGFLRCLWALLLAFVLAAPAFAQLKPVPPLSGRVVDEAGMLDASQRERLTAVLADYEARTGSQIAVLLVKSTEPEAIEQFSIRVTDAWKLGRKGIDDGVLLMVARDNPSSLRRLRIEAGRGVQGVLTDAQSKRILQDVIAPHFRQNHYYEGLVAGVGAIATLLNKESFPAPQQQNPQPAPQRQVQVDSGAGFSLFGIIPLLIGFFLLRSIFRPRRSRLSPHHWGHRRSSGLGDVATGIILGNIMSGMGRGGGFGGGGGGFGGGGFSGGGGSFDGGGASGDW
ncbi:YgcG family protein [Massilia sp. LC238]|uniref:TPM domain-containing protein n=1 Tax=Massilia sp. LC238 TaxID=1502852 RepID=UPI0004E2D08D|nr:TPM domain-containing protein [Massilia sp. LC238]KFC63811.1 Glycine rich transmembrane protein [Massilia sp. LC238]